MRYNERQLINISLEKADFEGRLHYKKIWNNSQNSKGFKEMMFKLKANILFYFKLNDTRQFALRQPSGLFILEGSEVHYEANSETAFGFSITFKDEADRKHLFAARSESDVLSWINALRVATYGHFRKKLQVLQQKIMEKTVEKKSCVPVQHNLTLPAKPMGLDYQSVLRSSETEGNGDLIQF